MCLTTQSYKNGMFKKREGERETEIHSYTSPCVCRKGRAVQHWTKSSQAGMMRVCMCVRVHAKERERGWEFARGMPRCQNCLSVAAERRRQRQRVSHCCYWLLLTGEHCVKREDNGADQTHTLTSPPHTECHRPLLSCKPQSLCCARQKLCHISELKE